MLTELKNHGIRDVLLVCCDGLAGLPDAIAATRATGEGPDCVMPRFRNGMRFASWKDRNGIAAMLRPDRPDPGGPRTGPRRLRGLQPGKNCPAAVEVIKRAWEEFIPLLELPAEIRRVVYTTNAIESMNYQLEKLPRTAASFLPTRPPTEAST